MRPSDLIARRGNKKPEPAGLPPKIDNADNASQPRVVSSRAIHQEDIIGVVARRADKADDNATQSLGRVIAEISVILIRRGGRGGLLEGARGQFLYP